MTAIAQELSQTVGITRACQALDIPRSRLYPRRSPSPPAPHRTPRHALSAEERAKVRAVLNSERFMDRAPRQVYATLLDEGTYLCHWRTMYRILAAHAEVRERRQQRQHSIYHKPELLAEGPNQVWSWDITRLRGPAKWTHFALHTILDIFSRYVVGWMIAERESAELARQLIATAAANQQLTGVTQISQAMQSIDQATAQNVAEACQVESSARNLSSLASRLQDLVQQYAV